MRKYRIFTQQEVRETRMAPDPPVRSGPGPTEAHLAELGPGNLSLRVPLGFGSCRKHVLQVSGSDFIIRDVLAARPTQQLVSQHVELLLVQAPLGGRGELPAEDLGQLRPGGRRRREEELQVLRMRRETWMRRVLVPVVVL